MILSPENISTRELVCSQPSLSDALHAMGFIAGYIASSVKDEDILMINLNTVRDYLCMVNDNFVAKGAKC